MTTFEHTAFRALRQQLCVEDFDFVSKMFREHSDRVIDLMLERGGESLTDEEFASFAFDVATRVAAENGVAPGRHQI